MKARCRARPGRPSMAGAVRGTIVGLLMLVVALVCGSSAQAAVIVDPGIPGGEILGNPVPAPLPVPNVLPLPPPRPREPGFAPAPGGPEAHVVPVPAPRVEVHDGPGSGPTVPPPVQVDADAPAGKGGKPVEKGSPGNYEPVGKLTRTDPKFLKRRGFDPHLEKGDAGMGSGFDLYLDQVGNVYGVAKGEDPKYGEWLGRIDRR